MYYGDTLKRTETPFLARFSVLAYNLPFLRETRLNRKFYRNNYTAMVEIEVDKYYSNRGYYPYMTAQVFDALEAAYLSGAATALVPETDYYVMVSNINASLCKGQTATR